MINPAHYNKYFIWKKNGIKWSIRIIDHHYCLNCLHELLLAGKIEWSTNRFLISWHVLIFSLWLSLTRLTWDNFFFCNNVFKYNNHGTHKNCAKPFFIVLFFLLHRLWKRTEIWHLTGTRVTCCDVWLILSIRCYRKITKWFEGS